MKQHCCEEMASMVNYICDIHPDPYDCPDNLITYSPKLGKYGFIVHDGGISSIKMKFCHWCGKRLSKSKRIKTTLHNYKENNGE